MYLCYEVGPKIVKEKLTVTTVESRSYRNSRCVHFIFRSNQKQVNQTWSQMNQTSQMSIMNHKNKMSQLSRKNPYSENIY